MVTSRWRSLDSRRREMRSCRPFAENVANARRLQCAVLVWGRHRRSTFDIVSRLTHHWACFRNRGSMRGRGAMSPNDSAAAKRSLWEWLWAIAFWLTRIVGAAVVITVAAIWPSTPVVVVVVVVAVLAGVVQLLIGLQRGKKQERSEHPTGEGRRR